MRLTKQTSYALRILIHCAVSGEKHVKAADIAAEHGITEFNVAKIVPILVRGGFIATLEDWAWAYPSDVEPSTPGPPGICPYEPGLRPGSEGTDG